VYVVLHRKGNEIRVEGKGQSPAQIAKTRNPYWRREPKKVISKEERKSNRKKK